MMGEVVHGDCVEHLKTMAPDSVDAVVTDPPYGLVFMGKGWDDMGHGSSQQAWHSRWAVEALRVLKPGAHLVAFGGTRTYHRLVCALEDAGFEIRDQLAWLFGSGFPKSLNVSKAIDREAGVERNVMGCVNSGATSIYGGVKPSTLLDITHPATPDAVRWDGWGTALKPAFEPILWATKPLSVVSWGDFIGSLHHQIGALIWQLLSPANAAKQTSPSNRHEQPAVMCASALADVAMTSLLDESVPTVTFDSPEAASTSLSIVKSWSAILGALSRPKNTSITSTESSTITALKILNSILEPVTLPSIMPPCGCLLDGLSSTVLSVGKVSSAEWLKWQNTLKGSVPVTVIDRIAPVVASVLAQIVGSLSDDPAEGSSVLQSATTTVGESLYPAHEPIVLARKPFPGTVAGNVLEWGTGGLNIDATRIGTEGGTVTTGPSTLPSNGIYGEGLHGSPMELSGEGRWPANVVLDEVAGAMLDEQSGQGQHAKATGSEMRPASNDLGVMNDDGWKPRPIEHPFYGDQGGASRFFYCAKASTSEREYGLNGDGSNRGNTHPTVKPVDLMRWLVRLVTPPGGLVLDPFTGSGTTGVACKAEGFRFLGVEQDEGFVVLARERIAGWVEGLPEPAFVSKNQMSFEIEETNQ